MHPVAICHRCMHRGPLIGQRIECKIDGRDITDHAMKGDCPDGRFNPQGPVERIPDDFDVEEERRRLRQGGCCGTPSEN